MGEREIVGAPSGATSRLKPLLQEQREKRLLVGPPAALAAAFGELAPNTTRVVPDLGTLLWLRPDQWLLLGPGETPVRDGVAVLDAGARFVEFTVAGPDATGILASGCSLDFRPKTFAPGRCAQSRIEQVPVILHREAFDRFAVIVERPLARYLERWLTDAESALGEIR